MTKDTPTAPPTIEKTNPKEYGGEGNTPIDMPNQNKNPSIPPTQ